MKAYSQMNIEELEEQKAILEKEYEEFKEKGMKLDISRGKPSKEQLDISEPVLSAVSSSEEAFGEDGTDTRNYGMVDGLPEAKRLMGEIMGADPSQVIVCGNSSLNIMYDTVARAYMFGVMGETPWSKLDQVKFLCPVPGYDRHFGVTQQFGIQMIQIPIYEDGPDMDKVEEYVNNDPAVKGIWCVPLYSNPTGCVYSDETVRRFANLKPAAKDFRIFWDNAYAVHHLYPGKEKSILNILEECEKAGNPDIVYQFCSTSKITFSGAGIAAVSASKANVEDILSKMKWQTIGFDKINQLRHVKFFKNIDGINEHMKKHADIIRPKFEIMLSMLDKELGDLDIATWSRPVGGYFISFDAMEGCAKKIVARCKEAGVVMTGAGAAFPYGNDPKDSNIRIAPTMPPISELEEAAKLFILCVKLTTVEKLLEK